MSNLVQEGASFLFPSRPPVGSWSVPLGVEEGRTFSALTPPGDSIRELSTFQPSLAPERVRTLNREEFWLALYRGGVIHHTAFSAIRFAAHGYGRGVLGGERSSEISLVGGLWFLSATPEGRAGVLRVLGLFSNRSPIDLLDAKLRLHPPLSGLFPLKAPWPLTTRALEDLPLHLTADEVDLWLYRLTTLNGVAALPPPSLSRGVPLTVLTLNVWGVPGLARGGAARFAAIGNALRARPRGVVALQEMWDKRSRTIIQRAQAPYVATSPDFPGLIGRGGLVTLSQFPILDQCWSPYQAVCGVEAVVKKGVLLTRHLIEGDETMVCANTHVVSPPERGSHLLASPARIRETRLRQLDELTELVHRFAMRDENVLVLGDLNCDEGSEEYDFARASFGTDLFRARHPLFEKGCRPQGEERIAEGATYDPRRNDWSPWENPVRLDYIFGRCKGTQGRIADARLAFTEPSRAVSDHFGVEIELLDTRRR